MLSQRDLAEPEIKRFAATVSGIGDPEDSDVAAEEQVPTRRSTRRRHPGRSKPTRRAIDDRLEALEARAANTGGDSAAAPPPVQRGSPRHATPGLSHKS